MKIIKLLLVCLIVILGAIGTFWTQETYINRPTYEQMIAKATESVVKIDVNIRIPNETPTIIDDVFTDILTKAKKPDLPPSTSRGGEIGSGFIIDEKGIIVTNDHVIGGGTDISVILKNNKHYPAHVIASDKNADIAVLQIDGPLPTLSVIKFGDSNKLEVGQAVSAVGAPLELEQTVTRGIISALNREGPNMKTPYNYFIQTDAPINPGNSGGPLLNSKGEVVGINEFIVSPTKSSIGLGFSITSNFAKFVVAELINNKKFQRNYIGVGIEPVDKTLLDLIDTPDISGIYVSGVTAKSPNFNLIKAGDIITEVEGVPVTEMRELIRIVTLHSTTEPLTVTVLRNNTYIKVQLKVYTE
jgi:S1-C subfamily serine protease